MKNIKYFIVGLIVGCTITGIAWAATSIVLVNTNGIAVGTSSNPIYIK